MPKSKNYSTPETAELDTFALNAVLTGKGQRAQHMLTKELLMMSGRKNDIVSSARFFTLKLPVPILAHISYL